VKKPWWRRNLCVIKHPSARNDDILFFFMSQLILSPVVLPLPFLALYKALSLLDRDSAWSFALHADGSSDCHLDHARPIELDEAAFVDGLSTWGTFTRIVLPLSVPGMAAALILSLVLCWNEYFFGALLTSTDAKTLPIMVASQTGS
jgi:multiple sugar transport system permease protein